MQGTVAVVVMKIPWVKSSDATGSDAEVPKARPTTDGRCQYEPGAPLPTVDGGSERRVCTSRSMDEPWRLRSIPKRLVGIPKIIYATCNSLAAVV